MKNSLKFQLDRMYRLMENKIPSNKKIISEQVLTKLLELVEYFGKSKDEIINSIEKGGFKESERIAQSFENLLDKEIRSLSQEEYQFVSAIIRRVVPEVFESFERNLEEIIKSRNSVAGFFNSVKAQLVSGRMTAQEFVYNMRTMYQKDINIEAVILYIEKLKNVSTDIVKIPESWSDQIFWALKNIIGGVGKVPAEFFKILWEELTKTKFPSLLSNLKNGLKISYGKTYDINLKPLEKEMSDQLDMILQKIKVGGSRDFTNEIKIITNKLQEYRTQRVVAAKTHFDEFLKLLKEEPKFSEIFDPKSPNFYKKWYSKNGESQFLTRLLEGYEKSEKILPKIEITVSKMEGMMTLLKAINPVNKTVSFWSKETWSRLGNMFLFWSPRSLEEEIINKNILGFRSYVVRGVAQKIIFSVFVLGFWYSISKSLIDYILSSVNASKIAKGEKPYDWIDKITQEDMNEIKDYGDTMAIFALWINLWSKSTRFIIGDTKQADFWSPAAKYCPMLFKLVNEISKPKPNVLPILQTIKKDTLQNEVRTSATDSINNLNNDPKGKEFIVDTLNLSVPTGDQIIEKSDSLISNLIK